MSAWCSSIVESEAAETGLEGLARLPEEEAQRRLAKEGPNELAAAKPRGVWVIGLEVVREPMFLLLTAAASLYFVMGQLGDASMLLASVLFVLVFLVVLVWCF